MTILLRFTSLFTLFSSLVLSHQQHLVRTKQVWSLGSVRLRWCERNHLTLVRNKSAGRDLPEQVVSVRLRCESEHTAVRCSSKKHTPLSHLLSHAHYGNYCLISGNMQF